VIKVGLTLALAFSLILVGFSTQEAYAVADCVGAEKPMLLSNEIYLNSVTTLFKYDTSDNTQCTIGAIGEACTDISIHPTTGVLYCITGFGELFTIDRTSGSAGAAIGDLDDPDLAPGTPLTSLNSFDFKPNGQAHVTGTDCRFFELDYTTPKLIKKFLMTSSDHPGPAPDCIGASGDLVYDIVAGDEWYMSSLNCEGAAPGLGDSCLPNNGMYKVRFGPGDAVFISDLGFNTVHGADFVGSTTIITWATEDEELFRTTTAGAGTGTDDLATGIEVFGGTAVPILLGGTAIFIDKSSLLLGAVQLNAGWVTLVVFAGLGLVIYKISRKK